MRRGYSLTQKTLYLCVSVCTHTRIVLLWALVTTSVYNCQVRRKHLYFPTGSHLSKGDGMYQLQNLTSKFLVINCLHMNKNNRRSLKEEENEADRKRKVPSIKAGTKMRQNSKFKAMKFHVLEEKKASKPSLHLNKVTKMVSNTARHYHAVEYLLKTLAESHQVYIKKDYHILTITLSLSFFHNLRELGLFSLKPHQALQLPERRL